MGHFKNDMSQFKIAAAEAALDRSPAASAVSYSDLPFAMSNVASAWTGSLVCACFWSSRRSCADCARLPTANRAMLASSAAAAV